MRVVLFVLLTIVTQSYSQDEVVPAVRVTRLQLDYEKADISAIQKIAKWNSILKNSVLASLRFINKHWLICGNQEKGTSDCGKAQVTGESIGESHYRINVTFIAEKDPIKNAKVQASSTVAAVTQIGLKGGIFQYTNALKVLGKPNPLLIFDEAFFCYKGASLVDGDKCRLCPAGQYHTESGCTPCKKGHFQPEMGRASCQTCIDGKTTSGLGASKESDCFAICPPGYFYDKAMKMCEPCSLRGYQPEAGSDKCIPCPPDTVPLFLNSTSVDQCLENCSPGYQRSEDGSKCITCPLGSFKSSTDSVCMICPPGWTTLNKGSKDLSQCNHKTCYPGTFLNTSSLACSACDYGLYQDEYDGRICKQCPISTSTYQTGANSITQCQSTNQCKSGQHSCHWLAVCMDLPDDGHKARYSCKCRPGYIGNGYKCVDICDGYCQNGASCLKTSRGDIKCMCKNGFTGRRCEDKK